MVLGRTRRLLRRNVLVRRRSDIASNKSVRHSDFELEDGGSLSPDAESFGLLDLRTSKDSQRSSRTGTQHRGRASWMRGTLGCANDSGEWRGFSRFRRLCSLLLMILGLYQVAVFASSVLQAVCPDRLDFVLNSVGPFSRFGPPPDPPEWTQPVSCLSHNDEWRHRPLFTALEAGCTGIEADVWFANDDLLVGHVRHTLDVNQTLEKVYLIPLLEKLDEANAHFVEPPARKVGMFWSDPMQTLVFLVDFKHEDEGIWHLLNEQLQPFRQRNYLTHFNGTDVVEGPITVVVSGSAPFKQVIKNPHYRDIFYDAPLDVMGTQIKAPKDASDPAGESSTVLSSPTDSLSSHPLNAAVYSTANSYYASVSFKHAIGYPWHSRLSSAQLELIRQQVRGAHARGLKARYWGVPSWPLGLRNYLWRVLVREGVDILSVDDVMAVSREDWGPRKGGALGRGRRWWE